jgi:anti-sigma factor RsiW
LERPFDKHIDNDELNALVPWATETGQVLHELSPEAIREAERHAESCVDCSKKVAKYRKLLGRLSNVAVSGVGPPGAACPKDIDWFDVAAGLRPKFKARQLIMHAALCDHCGPLLRTATFLDHPPTPEEELLLAELKPPSRPDLTSQRVPPPPPRPGFMRWLVPAVAMILIVVAIVTLWPTPLSGAKYADFAVKTHRQYAQGNLALDVRSDSQETLNEWFKAKSPFSLALPTSPAAPGEERPYRLEGARLVQVGSKSAVYIAYRMQTGPASLVVTPDSVAAASGGVQVDYKKVTFHYRMVEGYKVVTWSLHGRTYALVSEEGNSTQRSCMICHSPMRDRDLSQTPTPLRTEPRLQ